MFEKYKKIIIPIVVLVLLFAVYNLFLKPDESGQGLFTRGADSEARTSAQLLGAEIIQALNQIRDLKIDDGVFEHRVLTRLVDKTITIEPQDKGRVNPFAPLGENEPLERVEQGVDED